METNISKKLGIWCVFIGIAIMLVMSLLLGFAESRDYLGVSNNLAHTGMAVYLLGAVILFSGALLVARCHFKDEIIKELKQQS